MPARGDRPHLAGLGAGPIAHCRSEDALPPAAMQLAACVATLPPCRAAALLPASSRSLRCRARPRRIARASDGEQGPAPPAPPPPSADQQPGEPQPTGEEVDKSLQLPPDVIQQLRTTVFR